MYDYNLTASETADFIADMLEMAGDWAFPSDEAIEEMAAAWEG